MSRELAKRLSALETAISRLSSGPDLSHLSDRQLQLIERCIDRQAGQWNAAAIDALSDSDRQALDEAVESVAEAQS